MAGRGGRRSRHYSARARQGRGGSKVLGTPHRRGGEAGSRRSTWSCSKRAGRRGAEGPDVLGRLRRDTSAPRHAEFCSWNDVFEYDAPRPASFNRPSRGRCWVPIQPRLAVVVDICVYMSTTVYIIEILYIYNLYSSIYIDRHCRQNRHSIITTTYDVYIVFDVYTRLECAVPGCPKRRAGVPSCPVSHHVVLSTCLPRTVSLQRRSTVVDPRSTMSTVSTK